MRGELYRRWLDDGRDLTLGEFVAERRAEVRQQRAQRRWAQQFGVGPADWTQMQQAPPQVLWQQLAGIQNAPFPYYRGIPAGALQSLLGGLFR